MEKLEFDRGHVVQPIAVVFLTMVILHVLIAVFIPMRWPALRSQFHRKLQSRLDSELTAAYGPLPGQLADDLAADRERTQRYIGDVRNIAAWLQAREQAASVGQLFG